MLLLAFWMQRPGACVTDQNRKDPTPHNSTMLKRQFSLNMQSDLLLQAQPMHYTMSCLLEVAQTWNLRQCVTLISKSASPPS